MNPARHSISVPELSSSLPYWPQEVKCKQKAEHVLQAYFEELEHRHEQARRLMFAESWMCQAISVLHWQATTKSVTKKYFFYKSLNIEVTSNISLTMLSRPMVNLGELPCS